MNTREMYRAARMRAQLAGETRFYGSPCSKCGGEERRVLQGDCYACHKATHRRKPLAPEQHVLVRALIADGMTPQRASIKLGVFCNDIQALLDPRARQRRRRRK